MYYIIYQLNRTYYIEHIAAYTMNLSLQLNEDLNISKHGEEYYYVYQSFFRSDLHYIFSFIKNIAGETFNFKKKTVR